MRLLVTEPADAHEPPATFELAAPLVVGRDPSCDVVLLEPSVSLRHGRFALDPQGLGPTYTDLQSTNGSLRVRGGLSEPCPPGTPIALAAGDTLRLGDPSAPVEITLHAVAPRPELEL
ncbi:MAG: FHA domain-containing protein, partial [Deltaproteobacteria bacterium]|nr:FHA domain-containing protein [Deltaproteobacteria bacterium]